MVGEVARSDAFLDLRSRSDARSHEGALPRHPLPDPGKIRKSSSSSITPSTCDSNSDPRIKAPYPLAKSLQAQADHELNFANGFYIIGIPGGADQIRSYHAWGYLSDESSFQADAGKCYNEALAAAKGKIIFNSSAGPGWYADARRDIVRNEEE